MTDQELKHTPVLEGLLRRLRRRLVAAVWLHGLGTLLLALALWTLFAFELVRAGG